MTLAARTPLALPLPERTGQLAALFRSIAATGMAGVPLCNPVLQVEAVGFAPWTLLEEGALGVLVTPWCMNLVWFPLNPDADASRVGESRTLSLAGGDFALIGAFDAGFGAYGACSLFSPMFDFASHAEARATAQAVLDQLQPRPRSPTSAPLALARRAFLFGKAPAQGAPA